MGDKTIADLTKDEMVELLRTDVAGWNRLKGESGRIRLNLAGVHLSKATLSGADLSGVNLTEATLWAVNLIGANLWEAILNRVDLIDANLERADLRHAAFPVANLSRANLTGANLLGSLLNETVFGDTLLPSENLEPKFHGPCTIDMRTIQKSWPPPCPLPKDFLRGCGLSDVYIDYLPSLMNDPLQFYSCFISHSSADKEFASKLENDLQAQGVRCWFDEKALLPGDDILFEIDKGIKIHDKTILVCSEDALHKSWWVEKEVKKTFDKEQSDRRQGEKKIRLIPITIDDFVFNGWDSELQSLILERKVGDFRNWKDTAAYRNSFERLMKALNQAVRPEKLELPKER